jgi:hypothetical protein
MSDGFILEVTGAGDAIVLEPVGLIDVSAARTVLAAMSCLSDGRHPAVATVRLDRVTGLTADAREVLSGSGIMIDDLAGTSVG